jgi:hypothetical protein
MSKIINFNTYKSAKEKLKNNIIVSPDNAHPLKRLAVALIDGNLEEVAKLCKRRNWTFSITLNDLDFASKMYYTISLDLDPLGLNIDNDDYGCTDLFIASSNNLNDALIDLYSSILKVFESSRT